MDFSANLLKVLSCPLSGGKLTYNKLENELISENAGLAYPIVDGIPILLIDKARRISPLSNKGQSESKETKKSKKNQSSKVA